jgi:hypothetical protein
MKWNPFYKAWRRYGPVLTVARNTLNLDWKEDILSRALCFAKQYYNKVNYLEFGVYKGYTFCRAYHAAEASNVDAEFYAFDCFTGLPEPRKGDEGEKKFVEGAYECSKESFIDVLNKNRVDLDKVEIVEGLYEETLTEEAAEGIGYASVVYVDSDYYSSAKEVLEWLTDLIRGPVVVIFDDWYLYGASPFKGEQRAYYEWLEAHPELVSTQFWIPNAFVINKESEGC